MFINGIDLWLDGNFPAPTPHVEQTLTLPRPLPYVKDAEPVVTMPGQQVGVAPPPEAAPLAPLEVTVSRSSDMPKLVGLAALIVLVVVLTSH